VFSVDLNCDLGESFGAYTIGMDEDVIPYVTSANVACGFHAGDPLIMQKTVQTAGKYGVHIGAHPGFPDLAGFGRRNMQMSPAEIKAMIQYQVGALLAFCMAEKKSLQHVKPHGALYNMAVKDAAMAEAICEGIAEVDPNLILLGPAGSELMKGAQKNGLLVAREVFADRAYEEDGTLVARSKAGAMITDEAEAIRRVVKMVKNGTVTAITGREIEVQADSVCVHGDGPKALDFVRKISGILKEEGIQIRPLREIVK